MNEIQEVRVAALELAIKLGKKDLKLLYVAEELETFINYGIQHGSRGKNMYAL